MTRFLVALGVLSLAAAVLMAVRGVSEAQPSSHASNPGERSWKVSKTDAEWKEILNPEQYRVLREKGTERAFTGEYDRNKEKGTYVCAGCGNPLYSSDTKFDSGTGWPSFWAPLSEQSVETETDRSLFLSRTEVLCKRCDGHLGHVFDDGPKPTGQRYCMNSVAMKFVPEEQK